MEDGSLKIHLHNQSTQPDQRIKSVNNDSRPVPVYRHPELAKQSDDSEPGQSPTEGPCHDTDGNITDGDDPNVRTDDKAPLDSGRVRKGHLSRTSKGSMILGKRSRGAEESDHNEDTTTPERSKRRTTSPEDHKTFDLTLLSTSPHQSPNPHSDLNRTSSPSASGSEDEAEMDELRERLLAKAKMLEEAAEIFDALAASKSPQARHWLKAIYEGDIGRDVVDLVHDVEIFEGSGGVLDPEKMKEIRDMRNIIGYQIRR